MFLIRRHLPHFRLNLHCLRYRFRLNLHCLRYRFRLNLHCLRYRFRLNLHCLRYRHCHCLRLLHYRQCFLQVFPLPVIHPLLVLAPHAVLRVIQWVRVLLLEYHDVQAEHSQLQKHHNMLAVSGSAIVRFSCSSGC